MISTLKGHSLILDNRLVNAMAKWQLDEIQLTFVCGADKICTEFRWRAYQYTYISTIIHTDAQCTLRKCQPKFIYQIFRPLFSNFMINYQKFTSSQTQSPWFMWTKVTSLIAFVPNKNEKNGAFKFHWNFSKEFAVNCDIAQRHTRTAHNMFRVQ